MVETAGSIFTGSSALLADGLMNVDDTAALLLSIYSERKTRHPPDEQRTFGYARMDAFGGFVKGCLLLVTAFLALFQALRLLIQPQEIAGLPVIVIGGIAFFVNILSASFLKKDACCSLNAKSTYSCMAYDAIGSVAVVISGILSSYTTTAFFDVAAALLIAGFMLKTGWGIFREGMGYFLQSAPEGFDYPSFEREVKTVQGVSSVGDIHVWSFTPTEHHLTCKVVLQNRDICDCDRIISAIEQLCRERFHIEHATIQPVYSAQTLQRFCKTV